MKGIHFYADLPGTLQQPEDTSGRYGNHPTMGDKPVLSLRTTRRQLREYAAKGGKLNCLALFVGNEYQHRAGFREGLVSTFGYANSDVSVGIVCPEILRKCRRIDEKLARQLHPRLAQRLDAAEFS